MQCMIGTPSIELREALFNARDFEARSFNGCPEHVVSYEKICVDSGLLLFKAHFNGIKCRAVP